MSVTENEIIEVKTIRDKMMGRVEVLDKVKKLFLIPQLEMVAFQQIAAYYDVEENAIRVCYHRNKSEIDEDGVRLMALKDFRKLQDVTYVQTQSHTVFNCGNCEIKVPNRGTRLFSKRAVLRFGMLLRDSAVAQEVRTQLLNLYEVTDGAAPALVGNMSEEQQYIYNLAQAFSDNDPFGMMQASKQLYDFKNQQIVALKEENALVKGTLAEWNDRSKIVRAIRIVANYGHVPYAKVWDAFYSELQYKFSICLKQRGERKKPYIQYLHENEYVAAQQAIVNLCTELKIDVAIIMKTARIENSPTGEDVKRLLTNGKNLLERDED